MDHIETKPRVIKRLFTTGFFHIMGAGTINRVLIALLSLVLVRILSKSDYGSYAYAYNIASFFIIFNGMGATTAVLQICTELHEDMKRARAFFRYGYEMGLVIDVGLGLLIVIIGLFVPLAIEGSNGLLVAYCVFPLLMFLNEFKLTQLRIKLQNKEYAFGTNVQTGLVLVFSIAGAALFQAIGLVVGQALAYGISYVYLCIRHPFRLIPDELLDSTEKKEYWGVASISAVNVGISQALSFIGTFLVGALLLNEDAVADFQAAMLVPLGLGFIPSMLLTYAYPIFVRHKDNASWTLKSYRILIGGSVLFMGMLSFLISMFAPWLVPLVFGVKYASIISVIQVLMIGFFLNASLRQPTGNLLVSQRKLLFNTFNGIVSILVNVIASLLFIPEGGVMGAAFAYVVTMGISSLLSVPYYLYVIRSKR